MLSPRISLKSRSVLRFAAIDSIPRRSRRPWRLLRVGFGGRVRNISGATVARMIRPSTVWGLTSIPAVRSSELDDHVEYLLQLLEPRRDSINYEALSHLHRARRIDC